MENPDRFVVIRFVVRYRRLLPWLAALLAFVFVLAGGNFESAGGLACAAIDAVIVWGVARLGVEIVDLVAETLLPR